MFSHIHFQSLPATDVTRARDFDYDKMGFTVERDEAYGEGGWIFLALPDAHTMLQFDQVATIAPTQKPERVLVTKDIDAACATLRAKSVSIHLGPDNAPWNPGTRWAMIHDSEGNLVLIQTV